MRKGTHQTPEAVRAMRLAKFKKSMPPEEFARFLEAPDGTVKWCPKCKRLLPAAEFGKSSHAFDGLSSHCKACHYARTRAWHARKWREDPEYRARTTQKAAARREKARAEGTLQELDRKSKRKSNYGLTPEAVEAMLASQGYRCAICRKRFKGHQHTHIDHDHSCCPSGRSCGKCIRGILCNFCNQGLGRFRDDPALLRRSARYLERYRDRRNVAEPDFNQGLLWEDSGAA